MKSISLYVDNGSWLCKVHPFTKLAYIATAISVPLLVGKLSFFAIFIALSLAVLASGRLLKRVVPLIAFSFTILITIFLIHGLFNQSNRNILFSIGPLHFYREGLLYALHIGCNVLNMLLSFAILVLSAKPSELVEELEKRGFSRRMGYIITSVFQIVPQMTGTMNTITDAQRSRGLETEGSLLTRAKAFLPLISPVVSFRFRPSGSLPSETSHAMGSVPFAKSRWLYAAPIVPPGRVSVVTVGGLSGTVSFTWIEAVTAGSGC